jgi:hypothetical protein
MRTFHEGRNFRAGALVAIGLALVGGPAAGQRPTMEEARAIREACRADYEALCKGVPMGSAAIECLAKNATRASPGCQQALAAVKGASSPSAAAPAASPAKAAAAPAASAAAGRWPHTVQGERGSATVYQPQVIAWPDRQKLETRAAVAITPTGAKTASYGTIDVSFVTATDLASRTVTLSQPQLVAVRFPTLANEQTAAIEERVRTTLAGLGSKTVPLDMVVASLRDSGEKPPAVELKNDPPAIFVSARPASLIVFDGEPVLTPISGTPLSFAVNTNWDIFFDNDTKTWYWLNDGGWLTARDVKGPWSPAASLPPAFSGLPSDASFADVKKQIPGKRIGAADVPAVFVSMVPAEIIVTQGPPQYVRVPGTALEYVTNTDAALFRMSGATYYYLVSGRWFSAPRLEGPWTYATPALPPDFARIPADGPRGFVLVSVPGTPQAQEALIEAQVPQQATLSKSEAKLDVVYAGEPKFQPIAGTTMSYAVNTSFNVVQVENAYYACYQGAWFVAPSPAGTWTLAPTVPQVIYTIPPGNPLYPCTYVRVYAATPETVTYGYTAGYTMGYVTSGVIVYGTGWYYPPYIYPGPIPIYYPYPYSYAGAAYYNSATGAWAHGGAIYGPYGGVAKGGSAYNPQTGAYARGGAVYGPYGGAGAISAYNPTTGGYVHGGAAWGPNGATGNASWYNPRTGVSGSTNQNSNAYGRWGSSTFAGPNQTVDTQSQSNARGSTGSFTSSSGAEGAAARGAGGNTAGAVKTSGGDVYAGADGNVYKKTDSGWEKYDNGSWNQVQKPQNAQSTQRNAGQGAAATAADRSSNLSGETQRGEASRSGGDSMSQLERDRQARTTGMQGRGSFGGGGMRGGGGGRGGGRR